MTDASLEKAHGSPDRIVCRLFETGDAVDAGVFLDPWLADWQG